MYKLKIKNYKNKQKSLIKKKKKKIGFFIFRSIEGIFLNQKHLEALRISLSRNLKKKKKYFINKKYKRIPVYKKALKTRMGSGKSSFINWIFLLKKNQKCFEISFFFNKLLVNFFFNKLKKKFPYKLILTNI